MKKKYVAQMEPGDKAISNRMQWIVLGTHYTITRKRNSGSVNASSRSQNSVEWTVSDNKGESFRVPEGVNKHEVSIARWLLAR